MRQCQGAHASISTSVPTQICMLAGVVLGLSQETKPKSAIGRTLQNVVSLSHVILSAKLLQNVVSYPGALCWPLPQHMLQ